MNYKDLVEIAKTCRRLGISHIKTAEFELDFGDIPQPLRRKSRSKKSTKELVRDPIDSEGWDSLTLEEQLNWSSSPLLDTGGVEEVNHEDT